MGRKGQEMENVMGAKEEINVMIVGCSQDIYAYGTNRGTE